jgi:aminobenzoyl-glutamate transport protein
VAGGLAAGATPEGEITAFAAPLMRSIVPLIFIFFLIPGVVYGYVAGTVRRTATSSRA